LKSLIKNIVLSPFSLVYGLVTSVRNWFFDQGILKTTSFSIPIICVGNISVGGTGKTPHTEFVIGLLQSEWKTAMLSRGYKRTTKGFVLADEKSVSQTIGDEPFQIYQKFTEITVAVDEKRVRGVRKLMDIHPDFKAVILDDAFQHRYIHSGLSILLTDFSNLYTRDMVLPAGTLREWKSGSKRADIIVVTKCPADLKPIDMRIVETEIKPENNQMLFFSTYIYNEIIPVFPDAKPGSWSLAKVKESDAHVLLVAGIVNPEPIIECINKYTRYIDSLFFGDHHNFSPKDYAAIANEFDKLETESKIILTTEKDAARLVSDQNYPEKLKSRTFALPIRVEILNNQESLFIQKIKNYVVENTRNC
jgi:tetraacyldisaccharide 4'-kinase